MRSCAEVLRELASRPVFDAEGRDMLAFLVFNLRGIYRTIDESAGSWDERGYWKKAEGLRDKWRWARIEAERLHDLLRAEAWHQMPEFLIGLSAHFAGVKITTMTRDADWWCGAWRALSREDGQHGT
jgi:hypothetical protein